MRVPVWPTCWLCERQPRLVTTRETPTAAPSSSASSSIGAKPSGLPTPRPPPTTTRASASEMPALRRQPLRDLDAQVLLAEALGDGHADRRRRGLPEPAAAATPSKATVSSAGAASRTASSMRLPAQRCRLRRTVVSSDRDALRQLATIGKAGERADMGHDLVAPVGAGGDERPSPSSATRARRAHGPIPSGRRRRARPTRSRRPRRHRRRRALRASRAEASPTTAAASGSPDERGEGSGEGECPQRGVDRALAVVFDETEDGHGRTPSCSSNSRSAGTASTPVPRISARWRSTTGTRSASFRTGSSCHSGATCSTTAFFARIRPGKDG